MTEAEWYGEAETWRLFAALRAPGAKHTASHRKFRLVACACVREVRDRLGDDASKEAVILAEQFADGEVTRRMLAGSGIRRRPDESRKGSMVAQAARKTVSSSAVHAAGDAMNGVINALTLEGVEGVEGGGAWADLVSQCHQRMRTVLLDILGYPFTVRRPDPQWPLWESGLARKSAQGIYDERRYADLPILSDALEEAGCADEALLGHLRGAGPHVRGCWALDLVLGKS
ncbi:MAG: hypothetical protein K2W96_05635 [Gemmataceae bacterium]|nr:hypothetical protein [Gemmataceae bacterium]